MVIETAVVPLTKPLVMLLSWGKGLLGLCRGAIQPVAALGFIWGPQN